MENTHADEADEDTETDAESPPPDIEDSDEAPDIEGVFSTDEGERIETALDFVEDEDNPATLSGLLSFTRDNVGEEDSLDEARIRERARERGLIEESDDDEEYETDE